MKKKYGKKKNNGKDKEDKQSKNGEVERLLRFSNQPVNVESH